MCKKGSKFLYLELSYTEGNQYLANHKKIIYKIAVSDSFDRVSQEKSSNNIKQGLSCSRTTYSTRLDPLLNSGFRIWAVLKQFRKVTHRHV